MADSSFDPYYKWFGIPPKDQPPDLYRLLGVERFESDSDVIDAAANKQMAFLRNCASGPHVDHSQKLLNELAAARVCLLNPEKKVSYDTTLRAQSAPPDLPKAAVLPEVPPPRLPSAVRVSNSPPPVGPPAPLPRVSTGGPAARSPRRSKGAMYAIVAVTVAVCVLLVAMLSGPGDNEKAEKEAVRQVEAEKRAAEEEAEKRAAEEDAEKRAAEKDAEKRAAEEDAEKRAAEEDAEKRAAEEEAEKRAAEEEAARQDEARKRVPLPDDWRQQLDDGMAAAETPADFKALAEQAFNFADLAVLADNVDTAEHSLRTAVAAARKANDIDLHWQAALRYTSLQDEGLSDRVEKEAAERLDARRRRTSVLSDGAPPFAVQETLPIPSDEAQQRVLELFREVYGEAWKDAKTSAQRRALAEDLLTKARESKADAPTHFVLLRLTRDMAAMAGEVEMAFRAIDETAARFQVDALAMKADAIVQAAQAALTSDQRKAIAERARAVIDEAVEHDAFDVAQRVHKAAVAAVQNAEEWILSRELLVRYREIEPLVAAYAEIEPALETLDADPVDLEANLVVGRYYGFDRGNWDRGLPHLALGSDEKLKKLAIKELEGPKTADDQVALGDAWWDLASAMEDSRAQLVRTRAAHWYKPALPRLAGLERAKVEQRLAQLNKVPMAEQEPPLVKDRKLADPPKRPRKRQPETYTFVDEATVKEHWHINGQWRIEGEGIRLFHRGASIRFLGTVEGNVAIRIAYQLTRWCDLRVQLFGETLQFESGNHIATIVRKDDTIFYAAGNRAPIAVKVRQERLDMASDLEIRLESRYSGDYQLLIRGVVISFE